MRSIEIDDIINNDLYNDKIDFSKPKKLLARSLCTKLQNELMNKKNEYKYKDKPQKNYEVYKTRINNDEEIFIADCKNLPINEDKSVEVYFDKSIVLEIQKLLKCMNDNAINSCPEVMEMYEDVIKEKQNQLERLKKLDNTKYDCTLEAFQLMNDGILPKPEESFNKEEYDELNEKFVTSVKENKKLKKMLKISLDKYEEVSSAKNGFLSRIFCKKSKSM